MARRVVLSPRAEEQLGSLYDYVADRSGAARADLVASRLLAACQALADFPYRGVARDDLFPGLRLMGYRRQATIAFTVDEQRVTIQGVFWRGQDVGRAFDDP